MSVRKLSPTAAMESSRPLKMSKNFPLFWVQFRFGNRFGSGVRKMKKFGLVSFVVRVKKFGSTSSASEGSLKDELGETPSEKKSRSSSSELSLLLPLKQLQRFRAAEDCFSLLMSLAIFF